MKPYGAQPGLKGVFMNDVRAKLCAICGEERAANQIRFLVAENRWEDKLTILQWNEHMAGRDGIQVPAASIMSRSW